MKKQQTNAQSENNLKKVSCLDGFSSRHASSELAFKNSLFKFNTELIQQCTLNSVQVMSIRYIANSSYVAQRKYGLILCSIEPNNFNFDFHYCQYQCSWRLL